MTTAVRLSPFPEPVLYGVIGGSGVYRMNGIEDAVEVDISTPFGHPSDRITVGRLHGVWVAFLPRHGRHHIYTPSEVNYRANIFALKILGVRFLLSVTAVGSLRETMRPGDLVVVDQIMDRTVGRASTFFGAGCVAHVTFGHPTCPVLNARAVDAIRRSLPGVTVHPSGCVVTMEGPCFSTRAESLANRAVGGDLIGMTTATESKLAREAEIAHCVVAMVTDMDAWSDEPHVDVAKVMATLHNNADHAQIFTKAIIEAFSTADPPLVSEAHTALAVAIMTPKDKIPVDTRMKLMPIIAKYIGLD